MGDEPFGKLKFVDPTLDKFLYTRCNVSASCFICSIVGIHSSDLEETNLCVFGPKGFSDRRVFRPKIVLDLKIG